MRGRPTSFRCLSLRFHYRPVPFHCRPVLFTFLPCVCTFHCLPVLSSCVSTSCKFRHTGASLFSTVSGSVTVGEVVRKPRNCAPLSSFNSSRSIPIVPDS